MKFLSICLLVMIISCLFVLQTNGILGFGKKKDDTKGQCSLYKGRCGGTISNTCCKAPYKCSKQTKVCGKDKLCCVSESDVQRHKQESGSWVGQRGG